ncbi:MAG TPA: exodeoxyribonuclease VII large subunit [Acidimicrobiales bacterium]|nr:exodeoxyribonuclease VII large subunit [Acidimicrobiales bacterium]
MTETGQGALFAEEPTLAVGEVVATLARAVAAAFPAEVWVRGEVDGLRGANANGHSYFTLGEKVSRRGPATTLEAVLLAGDRRRIERTLAAHPDFRLANGLEVRVKGRVSYRFGRVRLAISEIDPVHTLGQLAVARAQVLRALADEGLLDANARRPLPAVPLRVGLVTSAGSAACEDALAELRGSGLGFKVLLADARVQGAEAENAVLRALRLLQRRCDVVLLVRGGGSRTDLATFDSERIARAVAAYPVPVITGVGHEIDTSVADEVAHTACKTPTAAAALLVEEVRRALNRVEAAWTGVAHQARVSTALADERLDDRAAALARRAVTAAAGQRSRLDTAADRVDVLTRVDLGRAASRLDEAFRRMAPARLDARLRRLESWLHGAAGHLRRRAAGATARQATAVEVLAARVDAVDPARAMARGWSLTRTADGRLVRSAGDVVPGTRLVTTVADGTVASTVDP